MIVRVAPIGAFGAMAFTIGAYGIGSLLPLIKLIGTFTVFALKGREELARGGRYSAGYPEDGLTESSTGFTLYMSAVLAASEAQPVRPRLFLPVESKWRDAAHWQDKGYAVVRAVAPAIDVRTEARRLRCSHALIDGDAVPL